RLRAHRSRAEGSDDGDRPRARRHSLRARHRVGRGGGPRSVNRRRLVRVPASSANLGPGYDCLAAALSLHLELEVEETGEFAVECELPGVALDRTNLCVRAFEELHPVDGLTFRIESEIPLASGLGSSAAAIVAGLVAADHMYELDADVYRTAAK